jgi:hypothetical protein
MSRISAAERAALSARARSSTALWNSTARMKGGRAAIACATSSAMASMPATRGQSW